MTDSDLISQYREGNEEAFTELVNRYARSLCAFIARYTPDAAEDVSQEVWLKVWRSLWRYNAEYSFKTWLYTIAKNTTFDYLKKKRVRLEASIEYAEDVASTEDLAAQVAKKIDSSGQLEALWGALSPSYRLVLELYYREEFSLSEIAQISGESVNTVKSRHRRALLLLKKMLAA